MSSSIPGSTNAFPFQRRSKKRCRRCRRLFVPDPRTAGWQQTCSRPDCQHDRHAASHRRWVTRNRDYYEGRYANTKVWLAERPGYLRRWRKK